MLVEDAMEIFLTDANNDLLTLNMLVGLKHDILLSDPAKIVINLSRLTWFDANMCAALGAVLSYIKRFSNSDITFVPPKGGVRDLFERNGFGGLVGLEQSTITKRTAIQYRKFQSDEEVRFGDYIDSDLLQRPELPWLSPGVRTSLSMGIMELFNNAVIHSRTRLGIFTCGQVFLAQEKIRLCICDLGVGMQSNVKKLVPDISAVGAIVWALQDGNTTKSLEAGISGGLGLKLLREFVVLNEGALTIASREGFCRITHEGIFSANLMAAFPGCLINLEVNTAGRDYYSLYGEELDEDNLL